MFGGAAKSRAGGGAASEEDPASALKRKLAQYAPLSERNVLHWLLQDVYASACTCVWVFVCFLAPTTQLDCNARWRCV